eukprot:2324636-Rhodomonas_salina.1
MITQQLAPQEVRNTLELLAALDLEAAIRGSFDHEHCNSRRAVSRHFPASSSIRPMSRDTT